jgi:hypothetical protein
MQSVAFASHVALLDPLTGEGLLVLPLAADDLGDPLGGRSLHEVEWSGVVRHLDSLGWEPSQAEDGGLCFVGCTREGREVVGLFGREPVTGTRRSRSRLPPWRLWGGWPTFTENALRVPP